MTVGLSGHQKMPKSAYIYASEAIDKFIKEHVAIVGVCSLASGSDQLFASKVLESGGELIAVIPCSEYESTFSNIDLVEYKRLLGAATSIETLDFIEASEEAFFAAGKRVVELSDEVIAVWDGEKARGLGGTADIVKYAKSLGKKITIFWPDGVSR